MFKVNEDKCIGCYQCVNDCPVRDILMKDTKKAYIRNETCIKCGHCIAICPVEAVSTDTYDMADVKPYEKVYFDIQPDVLMNFIKFRRSVRRFKDKPVEHHLIETVIEAGRFTQTSTNSQDVSYVVLENELPAFKDTVMEVLYQKSQAILNNMTNETMHLKRYAMLWELMYKAYQQDKVKNDGLFYNAPAVILICSNAAINASLAASNMSLMVHALGLGGFLNGFVIHALSDHPEILANYGIPEGTQLNCCLVIGHPSVTYKRTVPRKQASIEWR
ncbi:MAG: nitroreductase family protein [bacterium]|nr:nitroreductase family protein [bacterium]